MGAVADAGGTHGQIRDFRIQRVAFDRQLFQSHAAVRRVQQRTLAVARETRKLRVDGRIQPDDESALTQQATIVGIEHGTTARREYQMVACGELGEQGALASAETFFVFEFEDQADRRAGTRLDFMIEIEAIAAA